MPDRSFNRVWDAICSANASKPALRHGERAWTYETLARHVSALRDELGPLSGRAFMFTPNNDLASVALILGALASGAVPILADPVWTDHERRAIMQRDRVSLELKYDARALATKMDAETLRLSDFASIEHGPATVTARLHPSTVVGRFTSGSTSLPRCLQFSWQAIHSAATGWQHAVDLTADDRVLCLATLNNGLAFNTSLLSVFLAGAELLFLGGPALLASGIERAIECHEPSVLVAFPFVFEMMMRASRRLPSPRLRCAVSSAAKLEASVNDYWRQQGIAICNYYGLVEVGPVTCNRSGARDSLGTPLPHVRLSITDERGEAVAAGEPGIVRVHSSSMATDYLDDESPTFASNLDAHGAYVTKDRATFDASGALVLFGRVDNLLNINGRKIEPKELEHTIRALSGVSDAVVTGEEMDGKLAVVAYVESADLTNSAVMQHCMTHLAAYKVPHFVHVLRQFPRSSTGKIAVGQMRLQVG